VVRAVTWVSLDGEEKSFSVDAAALRRMVTSYLRDTTWDDATRLHRRPPPLFDHWHHLLRGALTLGAGGAAPMDAWRWHPVMDERMPTLLTVSVTPAEPVLAMQDEHALMRATGDGDLVRLCFADGAGAGATFLYDVPDLAVYREAGTLFMVSGYAFVAYGAGGFFDNVVAAVHMRRHYFQLGLLMHLELASLLSFSSRITRAVAEYDPSARQEERFEQMMHTIEDEYLRFIHRFRFTGASNHLQARELTALWRRQLRLPELFDDLHTEITSAMQYLFNRAASRGARTVERLTIIGTLGLVAGLTFSFLGMNVLVQHDELREIFRYPMTVFGNSPGSHITVLHPIYLILGEAGVFALFIAIFSFTTLRILRWVWRATQPDRGQPGSSDVPPILVGPLRWVATLALGSGVAAVAISYLLWFL
jgi:hypothetical protein